MLLVTGGSKNSNPGAKAHVRARQNFTNKIKAQKANNQKLVGNGVET